MERDRIEDSKDEELNNLALVWCHIVSAVDSMVLKWTLELGLADIIDWNHSPMTLSQLISALPISCPNHDVIDVVRRLIRYLVQMRLLRINNTNGEDFYALTSASKFILVNHEKSLVPFIQFIHLGGTLEWTTLGTLLEGKASTFQALTGEDLWSYASKHPEFNKILNEAMASDSRLVTPALIDGCSDIFQGIRSLVDVGGGSGTVLLGIAEAFPHIKCSVLDLLHVVEMIPDSPNVEAIAGDMFSFVPHADAVMLKWILHDWDDEHCLMILKRCKDAIPQEGGKVIVVDIVMDIQQSLELRRARQAFDVIMMLSTGGKERTEKEWRSLFSDAGYSQSEIKPIRALQSVIVASP